MKSKNPEALRRPGSTLSRLVLRAGLEPDAVFLENHSNINLITNYLSELRLKTITPFYFKFLSIFLRAVRDCSEFSTNLQAPS